MVFTQLLQAEQGTFSLAKTKFGWRRSFLLYLLQWQRSGCGWCENSIVVVDRLAKNFHLWLKERMKHRVSTPVDDVSIPGHVVIGANLPRQLVIAFISMACLQAFLNDVVGTVW